MTKLIDELKGEHAAIVSMLNKVRDLGIGSTEGQNTLTAAKDGLVAHLKKEDDKLYPVLKEAATKDAQLKHTMEIFAKDMEPISKAALEFFNKYATGGSGIEFARDFGRLYIVLTGRINKEENLLYEEYIKVINEKTGV